MDSPLPSVMRCHRGHLTPAEKTFCESCGASLHPYEPPVAATASATPAGPSADVMPAPRLRLSLRRIRRP